MTKRAKRATVVADISVPLFKIAARFCGSKDRLAISGVFVRRHPKGGVVLVGTDGHRMIVLHDEHGSCSRPFTLDAKEGLKRARATDKSNEKIETRWQVGRRDSRKGWRLVPLVDERFPNWAAIPAQVAATRGGAVQSLNPKYVSDFMKVSAELQREQFPNINLVPGKRSSDPLLILFPSAPHAFAIVMPMLRRGDATLPAFIRPLLPRKRRA